MRYLKIGFIVFAIAALAATIGVSYKFYRELKDTRCLFDRFINEKRTMGKPVTNEMICATDVSSKRRELWSSLQQSLKDTVPQVFSQVTEFNWVEPYKTPNQAEGSGTGFFIDAQGHLITNAHVVNQAKVVFIQIPSLGKRRFEVDVLGVSPDRDLALLKLKPDGIEAIKKQLNLKQLPYLKLGDSDTINRADKIMALGYPLGQQSLKSTTGVVSGREHIDGQHFIQISAALNPGNSGGPSLNGEGQVIGVNSAGIMEAQNVGYIIPINEVKLFLEQLKAMKEQPNGGTKLLRKPFLGVLYYNGSDDLTAFLKNPPPGGVYVIDVYKGSPLYKAGIQSGDMLYSINGQPIDIYGEMNVGWSKEDKVSLIDYISRMAIGEEVNIEFYRNGKRKNVKFKFDHSELPPIRRMYPGYEKIDYEVIGGMVIMELSINHILMFAKYVPELIQYADPKKHREPALIITHILLNSPAKNSRCISPGTVISHLNGEKVKTLDDFRKNMLKSIKTGFMTIKSSENVFVALAISDIIQNETRLASNYYYNVTPLYKQLLAEYRSSH